jgi:hypothetical protein
VLLRNKSFQPRVYFADTYEEMDYDAMRDEILGNYREAFKRIQNEGEFVYLNSGPHREFPEIGKDTMLEYRFSEYGMSSFKLETNTAQDTILVLSEVYYPKWRAKIDGKQTHVYRANYFYRAIVLPEGRHEVEFAYDGTEMYVSLLYFVVMFSACIMIYFIGCRRMNV